MLRLFTFGDVEERPLDEGFLSFSGLDQAHILENPHGGLIFMADTDLKIGQSLLVEETGFDNLRFRRIIKGMELPALQNLLPRVISEYARVSIIAVENAPAEEHAPKDPGEVAFEQQAVALFRLTQRLLRPFASYK